MVTGLAVNLHAVIASGPLPQGQYSVEWLDTYTAASSEGQLDCTASNCILSGVPDFNKDIAVILRLK